MVSLFLKRWAARSTQSAWTAPALCACLFFSLAVALAGPSAAGCSSPHAYLGWTHSCEEAAHCSDIPGTLCGEWGNCECPNVDEGYVICCQKRWKDLPEGERDCRRGCRLPESCDPDPPPEQCTNSFASVASVTSVTSSAATTGAGAGSGAMGSGGAGGGGAGGASGCSSAADCPGPADARCGYATCEGGQCGLVITPGPTASQIRGDCRTTYCDSAGNAEEKEDLGDFYNDGRPCSLDTCEGGKAVNMPYPNGLTCPELGYGVCYEGSCVECIDGVTQCPQQGDVCDGFYCAPMSCAVNQACGIGCGPCVPLKGPCAQAADCIEGVCVGGICAIPNCTDGVRNDGETGIDCGAPSCAAKCPTGQGCAVGTDCVSGVCWGALCQAPTCTDGVTNGAEDGPDCGGSCPLPCAAEP